MDQQAAAADGVAEAGDPPEPIKQPGEAEEDSLMLGLFLDFLSRQALTADQGPVLYTEAMAADDDELLAGVAVDAADELSRA